MSMKNKANKKILLVIGILVAVLITILIIYAFMSFICTQLANDDAMLAAEYYLENNENIVEKYGPLYRSSKIFRGSMSSTRYYDDTVQSHQYEGSAYFIFRANNEYKIKIWLTQNKDGSWTVTQCAIRELK